MKLSEKFKRMAELAEAQEAGEQLQICSSDGGFWEDRNLGPKSLVAPSFWRIKPDEPKRIWVNDYGPLDNGMVSHTSKSWAMNGAQNHAESIAAPYIELTPEVAEKLGINDET